MRILQPEKLPDYLSSAIQYSPAIESMVAYYHTYHYLPSKRMTALFNDIFNLPVSEGTIDNMLTRFANRIDALQEDKWSSESKALFD